MVNLLFLVLSFSLQFINFSQIFHNSVINTIFCVIFVLISYLYVLSGEILLIKAKLPWYAMFIPLYGDYIMCKMAFKKGYIFLILVLSYIWIFIQTILYSTGYLEFNIVLFLLCYVCLIIYIIMLSFNIGKRFGLSGWLTLFFPYIMLPIIAFLKDYQYIDEL